MDTSQLREGFLHVCGNESQSNHYGSMTFSKCISWVAQEHKCHSKVLKHFLEQATQLLLHVSKGFGLLKTHVIYIYIYFVTTYRFKIGSIWIPLTFELSTISDQKYHCNLHESASTYGCIWVPMYSRAALPALAAWEAVGPKHLWRFPCAKQI